MCLLMRSAGGVSIHASAREATSYVRTIVCGYMGFDPRLREGGDRLLMRFRTKSRHVSIHASAREATICRDKAAKPVHVSIHASAREATQRHGVNG